MNLMPVLRRLQIQDRESGLVLPWEMNWAQAEYIKRFHTEWNAGRPVRFIILKARQIGISTATQGIEFALCFSIDNLAGLTVAHEMDSSEHILGMTHRYWATFPFRQLYTSKYASKKHIEWVETGSGIKVVTAKNVDAGRSKTIRFLHASEVAFWEDADTLMLGLRQSVPNAKHTAIVLESTANGIGNYFEETWNAAVDGDSEFIPLFFPWWKHPEYTGTHIGLPPVHARDFDEEEEKLAAMDIIPRDQLEDRLAWRRYGIRDLCGRDLHKFHQEYPSTPEEAFVATGLNVFPISHLNECFVPEPGRVGRLVRDPVARNGIRFIDDGTGPLRLFRWPSKDDDFGRYMIGADPTGTIRGDYACAQVMNRRNAEQVGVYRHRIDPMGFAEELAKLGSFFNGAELAPEATGPGQGTIGRLIEMGYFPLYRAPWADKLPGILSSTFGWNTTFKSKEWAIGNLLKEVVDHDLVIHDAHTFTEMKNYVTLEGGGYGPASKKGHDDTVMACAIAEIASSTTTPLGAYGANPGTPLLPGARATASQAIDDDYWDTVLSDGWSAVN